MADDHGDQDNNPKPRCIAEVLQRVEQGATTKADADYLLAVLNRAGERIGILELQIAMLQRQIISRLQ